jgi:hypothetical protein
MLGTFTASTTPTDEQAQQVIDDAVAGLEAAAGDIPDMMTTSPDLAVAMRTYVEWRAAADIELAYPNRDADLQMADRLTARAEAAYQVVMQGLAAIGGGTIDVLPDWAFPDPPPYADQSPGSGIEFLVKPVVIPDG